MRPTGVGQLADLLGGSMRNVAAGAVATGWATDSRDVVPGTIFLAIKGARADGHDYVEAAAAKGAVAAVVERPVDGPHIIVRNLPSALARMASALRERFTGPVIGITGSAGKTTTKEFIAAATASLGPVLKTEGNRNTEYTAPLLWTELTEGHRVVVCEMGMRGSGHIGHLAAFARPTVGVVTNVGLAHMELVGDRAGIARAKGELLRSLPASGSAVLWQEDDYLDALTAASAAPAETFGWDSAAKCRVTAYEAVGWSRSRVEGSLDGAPWRAELPSVGRHIALDAAAAVLAAHCVGVAPERAAEDLSGATLPALRMEVREWNEATLLVDAYNASPASMLAAIEVLRDGAATGRRLAVIGEMRELGAAAREGHRAVGRALAAANLDRVMLFGAGTQDAHAELRSANYPDDRLETAASLDDVAAFLRKLEPGDVVLIKGSRSLELERAVPA